jgi:hypothetical protein
VDVRRDHLIESQVLGRDLRNERLAIGQELDDRGPGRGTARRRYFLATSQIGNEKRRGRRAGPGRNWNDLPERAGLHQAGHAADRDAENTGCRHDQGQ